MTTPSQTAAVGSVGIRACIAHTLLEVMQILPARTLCIPAVVPLAVIINSSLKLNKHLCDMIRLDKQLEAEHKHYKPICDFTLTTLLQGQTSWHFFFGLLYRGLSLAESAGQHGKRQDFCMVQI